MERAGLRCEQALLKVTKEFHLSLRVLIGDALYPAPLAAPRGEVGSAIRFQITRTTLESSM